MSECYLPGEKQRIHDFSVERKARVEYRAELTKAGKVIVPLSLLKELAGGYKYCPICNKHILNGHDPTCPIGQILKEGG